MNLTIEWASHLPALMACMFSTSGPVLELGVGHCSTPILHAACLSAKRKLVSVEQDPEWFNKFATDYACDLHEFILGEYDSVLAQQTYRFWSVVLVDESPGGERRASSFKTMLPNAEFVVVHDYHHENEQAIEPLLHCNYCVCSDYPPPTLVASLFRSVPSCLRPTPQPYFA